MTLQQGACTSSGWRRSGSAACTAATHEAVALEEEVGDGELELVELGVDEAVAELEGVMEAVAEELGVTERVMLGEGVTERDWEGVAGGSMRARFSETACR